MSEKGALTVSHSDRLYHTHTVHTATHTFSDTTNKQQGLFKGNPDEWKSTSNEA